MKLCCNLDERSPSFYERIRSRGAAAYADRVVQLCELSFHQAADHHRRDAYRLSGVADAHQPATFWVRNRADGRPGAPGGGF